MEEVVGEDEDSIPLADDDPSALVDDSIVNEDEKKVSEWEVCSSRTLIDPVIAVRVEEEGRF